MMLPQTWRTLSAHWPAQWYCPAPEDFANALKGLQCEHEKGCRLFPKPKYGNENKTLLSSHALDVPPW